MISLILAFLLVFLAIAEGYYIAKYLSRTALVMLLLAAFAVTAGLYIISTTGGSDSDSQDTSAITTSLI